MTPKITNNHLSIMNLGAQSAGWPCAISDAKDKVLIRFLSEIPGINEMVLERVKGWRGIQRGSGWRSMRYSKPAI
jgi:hypothetical protein